MAIKYYSLSQLKERALLSAQRYRAEFDDDDASTAYTDACQRCGFENPLSTDEKYPERQKWLIELMNIWFLREYLNTTMSDFDLGDMKLGQVPRRVQEEIDRREKAFKEAKEDPKTAYLFMSATDLFSNMVYSSGIKDDAVGVYLVDE